MYVAISEDHLKMNIIDGHLNLTPFAKSYFEYIPDTCSSKEHLLFRTGFNYDTIQ